MSCRIIQNPTEFRSNVIQRLNGIVRCVTKSDDLEKGVYNYTVQEATTRRVVRKWENPYFVRLYLDRLRSIMTNLKKPHMLNDIQKGKVKPHNFALMTHQEMDPVKWDTYIQAKMKRERHKYETIMEASTDTFTCRKCKSKKCNYYQMQTRSADEPMTTFVSCLECGHRWKC